MARLFTPEFCALLDELKAYDKIITRQTEDIYELLVQSGVTPKDSLYKDTINIINKKKEIRIKLKEMFDKFEKEKEVNTNG